MGATTLYHPISLYVIRGAVEYCGWKFGRIKQLTANADLGTARYLCKIDTMPRNAINWPVKTYQSQLQHCFMDDIIVERVTAHSDGSAYCVLAVTLNEENPDLQETRNFLAGQTK